MIAHRLLLERPPAALQVAHLRALPPLSQVWADSPTWPHLQRPAGHSAEYEAIVIKEVGAILVAEALRQRRSLVGYLPEGCPSSRREAEAWIPEVRADTVKSCLMATS